MASVVGHPMAQSSQEPMESIAGVIDKFLLADKNYRDLSDLLKVVSPSNATTSGLLDVDYPSLNDPKIGLDSLCEISMVKRVPLPPELVEQFGHMQCNCAMGLFPEISRAWLSIDSDIFVWNFEDGSDLAYFDGLNESILSATLVKPKTGLFLPHIQYLLVLATPIEIVLLGVSFEGTPKDPCAGEMHLLPDPLFSVPMDGTYITKMTGTECGRIFMTGKDGCLYELVYQAVDGWFSRKCRKVNHSTSAISFLLPSFLNFSFSEDDPLIQITIDESRHILYTRSEKGTLQVYDMGEDGKGMARVAAISQNTTLQSASLVARNIDRSNFKKIIHIAAVPQSESQNIHLIAITSSGVRLYFATSVFNRPKSRPSMLCLVHVRLPPGFSASASPQRPTDVHIAHYRRGTTVLTAAQTENSDLLWTLSPDTFPFQSQLMETQTLAAVDGRTWALDEVPIHLPRFESDDSFKTPGKPDPPLVVNQHVMPIRRFVLLSTQGSHLMDKYHPVNQLQKLLLEKQGPDSEDVKSFFQLHKEDQACATCLILACWKTGVDPQLAQWASRAFFLYGGEPRHSFISSSGGASAVSNIGPAAFSTPAHGMTSVYGGGSMSFSQPKFSTPISGSGMMSQSMMSPGFGYSQRPPGMYQPMISGPNFAPDIVFSGKHDGICLYLSRILRPLWDSKLVTDVKYPTPEGEREYPSSTFTTDELSWFMEHLGGLKEFFEANQQLTAPSLGEGMNVNQSFHQTRFGTYHDGQSDEQQKRRYQAEAQAQEKMYLHNIHQFICISYEVLGLWKILCDHQFYTVAQGLTKDQQNLLKTLTFRNFCIRGKDLCTALITCLISRYLDDNAIVDGISTRLREVCPSLYSSDDATCSKANEMLQSAKSIENKQERERVLETALQLLKQVTEHVNLTAVCSQLASVRYFSGIIDLCLAAASARDPQKLALHYYKNGEPPEDELGVKAFIDRRNAYKCVTDTLGMLLDTSNSHPHSPSVPKHPGPPPKVDPHQLTNAEAQLYSDQIFHLALKSTEELFHVALYDWLISIDLKERLLDIQSPFLEPYLKKAVTFNTDDIVTLDLLWKYYEKTCNFSAATRILAKLGERQSEINLTERIEYLSRAIMCAKSSTVRTSTSNEGDFLHELEEKMEVARLQLLVLEKLHRVKEDSPQLRNSIAKLNSELIDISSLYSDFAEKFNLAECKLAILHCASHHDPSLVESLWQDIINQELEATQELAPQSQLSGLCNKLITLGKHYSKSELYFPVAFLIKFLEKKSCQLSFPYDWVFKTMMDCGVKLTNLQEMYDRLFKAKDQFWDVSKRPLFLLHVIYQLLFTFADVPSQVLNFERRHFTTVCLDSIASYMVELQAMGTNNTEAKELMKNFKGLQARLERMCDIGS